MIPQVALLDTSLIRSGELLPDLGRASHLLRTKNGRPRFTYCTRYLQIQSMLHSYFARLYP